MHPFRLALRALRKDRCFSLAALGTAQGVGGALATGRVIQNLLIRTSPRDPIVLTAVAAFIALVAMIAAVIPARRAAQVDPMVALRHT
jgi:putative ABC transport system permease protein